MRSLENITLNIIDDSRNMELEGQVGGSILTEFPQTYLTL